MTATTHSTRLAQAESFLLTAELIVDDDSDDATPGVAASLAVLAGIAASDAACCARLGVRARGQSHAEAVELLGTVEPRGGDMVKDLQRLLNRKDDSQYGMAFVSAGTRARWSVGRSASWGTLAGPSRHSRHLGGSPPKWRHAVSHLDRAGRVQLPDVAQATMTDGAGVSATVGPEGWKLEPGDGSQAFVGLGGRGRVRVQVRVPPGVRHRLASTVPRW